MNEIEEADIKELIGQNKEILAKMDEMILLLKKIKSKRNKGSGKNIDNKEQAEKLKAMPGMLYSAFRYTDKKVLYSCSSETHLFEEKDLKFIRKLRPMKIINQSEVYDETAASYIIPVFTSDVLFFRGDSIEVIFAVLLAQFRHKCVIDSTTSKTITIPKIKEFKEKFRKSGSYKKYLDMSSQEMGFNIWKSFVDFVENPDYSGY